MFSHEHVNESPAPLECVVVYECFVWDVNGVDVRAPCKRVRANVLEVGGQKHAREVDASFEGFLCDRRAGEFNAVQVAAYERFLAYGFQRKGKVNFGELRAPLEASFWNFFEIFGQRDVGESRAQRKRVLA